MFAKRAVPGLLAGCLAVSAAHAGDLGPEPASPFLFTTTTTPPPRGRWTVHYDSGWAERAEPAFGYDGFEQRIGVQGSLGSGFTLRGQIAFGTGGGHGTESTQEAELLKDVVGGAHRARLALGLGFRREWAGTKVLLGRVDAGAGFGRSLLHANLDLERPLGAGRDGVDVITTLGWLRRLGRAFGLGLEAVGEDLEGLWEPNEAEGGAKLFVGPSLHLSPVGRRFHASLAGGPILYATRSPRSSDAPRPLAANGNGYTLRLSVGYAF
jgi:hypothetical protein